MGTSIFQISKNNRLVLHFPLIPSITKITVQTLAVGFLLAFITITSGCANMLPPSGGARDSIPPILTAESPVDSARNVTTNRFTFVFNEYVELQDIQQNVLISPTPIRAPAIDYKLRTVTVRLRDTLEPNTTYSINFGNAIKDINEGNVLKDFFYVFSTGNTIDSFTLSGKVTLAETGKVDSTLVAVLHKNLTDSAIVKDRPRYIARLDGEGNFRFTNLPAGTFALYAVPNNYNRSYNENEPFAFANDPVIISDTTGAVNLLAYIDTVKQAPSASTGTPRNNRDQNKSLKFSTNLDGSTLDILKQFEITFDKEITSFDSTKIVLLEDSIPQRNFTITRDTSLTRFTINRSWVPGASYSLAMANDAFRDSAGTTLAKADTINFTANKEEDYGTVKLRFNNLDYSKNPVLLILQNERIFQSVKLTQRDWSQRLFKPGEYDLRILYDANDNGRWDKGRFFGEKKQPEVVINLTTTLNVRANWDNEKEINL